MSMIYPSQLSCSSKWLNFRLRAGAAGVLEADGPSEGRCLGTSNQMASLPEPAVCNWTPKPAHAHVDEEATQAMTPLSKPFTLEVWLLAS